jgi:polar amino acid transport system substrate-binding protein
MHMHWLKKEWAALAVLVLIHGPPASAAEVLRVGITPAQPPMAFKQGGKIVGVEPDFAKALELELGREIKLVEVDWEDQIPKLLEGRTDIIMSSMSITKPRQFRVAFCTPYLRIGQMALVRTPDSHKYLLGFPAVPPGVIGVKKATTGDFLVQQEFPRSKRKEFSSPEQGARALIKGQIDLFIADATAIWWLAAENEAKGLTAVPIVLSEEHLAWAVRKSDTDLLDKINAALEKWQKDGSLNATIKHWVPAFTP